jgi:hypothetical protein
MSMERPTHPPALRDSAATPMTTSSTSTMSHPPCGHRTSPVGRTSVRPAAQLPCTAPLVVRRSHRTISVCDTRSSEVYETAGSPARFLCRCSTGRRLEGGAALTTMYGRLRSPHGRHVSVPTAYSSLKLQGRKLHEQERPKPPVQPKGLDPVQAKGTHAHDAARVGAEVRRPLVVIRAEWPGQAAWCTKV